VRVVKTVGSHGPGPALRREKGAGLRTGSPGQGPGPLDMLLAVSVRISSLCVARRG
jgi:hypothetical protein